MAAGTEQNWLRLRRLLISREFKAVFKGVPERFLGLIARRIWRWLFIASDGKVHRAGGVILNDLREFCHADKPTIFHQDATVMARREGRREVWVRIQNYLNLDEEDVRNLMELDDGR